MEEKKKKVNGRAKGNSSELKICRVLSEWWLKQDLIDIKAQDLPFRRSPLSGGWDRTRASGDVIKPDNCRLCIEVKNRQEWNWDQFFTSPDTWKVFKYWEQTIKAVVKDEIPLLIFTRNRHPYYVAMTIEKYEECKKITEDLEKILISKKYKGQQLVFLYLKSFIKINPAMFKRN